ncbi:MAG: hypothetical protein U1E60_14650 [Reyranellaceae bacterium]
MTNVFGTKRHYVTATEAARKCGPHQYQAGIRRTLGRLPMNALTRIEARHGLRRRLEQTYLADRDMPQADLLSIFEPGVLFLPAILEAMGDAPAQPGDLEGMQ